MPKVKVARVLLIKRHSLHPVTIYEGHSMNLWLVCPKASVKFSYLHFSLKVSFKMALITSPILEWAAYLVNYPPVKNENENWLFLGKEEETNNAHLSWLSLAGRERNLYTENKMQPQYDW